MSLIGWLRRCYLSCVGGALTDQAWKPTGLKFTTPREYDFERAKAGAVRARRRSASGRLLPKPKQPRTAEIVALRRAK